MSLLLSRHHLASIPLDAARGQTTGDGHRISRRHRVRCSHRRHHRALAFRSTMSRSLLPAPPHSTGPLASPTRSDVGTTTTRRRRASRASVAAPLRPSASPRLPPRAAAQHLPAIQPCNHHHHQAQKPNQISRYTSTRQHGEPKQRTNRGAARRGRRTGRSVRPHLLLVQAPAATAARPRRREESARRASSWGFWATPHFSPLLVIDTARPRGGRTRGQPQPHRKA
ncbi:Os08g0399900 [Oryza sativa Japonica Group]|uniref:Os08g0399900 protein n=2 Tax=Oryza sativa subsp. japonica TaxID=39947 RepID=Q0J5V0_ORYSJ|nr:hypothetical protein EE612_044127 [Oryza sativa]BAC99380.1 unknown protein [Oryza sativa Japonica Group]BAF23665.1 Os08g0399900 [Oryza sativa Japonica Group]BAT05334.1 Os08g0399900 [Oryza sativa Japonica Group]|eukprot:NP_001061751.1 Os08g0399900 [Oryza sativa Japonica Group]